jgi:peptidoglycan L-alanyl-D-glutamate endopeptidase CwlK
MLIHRGFFRLARKCLPVFFPLPRLVRGFFMSEKPMPTYSKTSATRLASCHIDIQVIWNELIKYIDCSVFCGHREEAEQNKAFFDDLSQLQWPDSKHNSFPSMAIDSGPYFVELRNTDWEDAKAFAKFAGFAQLLAIQLYEQKKITHVLRWGGDWDMDGRTTDQSFSDLPHFELVKP